MSNVEITHKLIWTSFSSDSKKAHYSNIDGFSIAEIPGGYLVFHRARGGGESYAESLTFVPDLDHKMMAALAEKAHG